MDPPVPIEDNDAYELNDIGTQMDETYGPRSGAYNLRERKPRDFGHLHTNIASMLRNEKALFPPNTGWAVEKKPWKPKTRKCQRPRDSHHEHDVLESFVMTQHNVRKGLKIFGDAGVEAVLKELTQLHDRRVLKPKIANELSNEERKEALQYLMFLKEKRDGTIKGRGCADGRKQRLHTTKEEASSPTVAIESVMLSCTVDAQEHRDVGVVDLPGAFMQADMEGTVHMKLEGKMAELMERIDPKLYRKFVVMENGKKVLYVQLEKALYGTLKAALLFWKLLSSKLIMWGFVLNPYDSCVANKDINGSQCTILWHVDDLKISHVDPAVVTDIIKMLESEFAKEAPLTISRGKVHEYLGMTIDYGEEGKVKFSMINYIKGMLNELPDDMTGTAPNPASQKLFEVDNMAVRLSKEIGDIFHHNTAKLLFLCKRARPDIQTAVAFLCTRVKAPDVDDYKKLRRVMQYLRATVYMPLTLEATDVSIVKWWADASFAVHPDMKSHTGGIMTLGKGAIYGTSTRQKINTKSSTEAELVGVNDVMPQVLWTRYFLESQGYEVKESIVYQDNKSTILLAENGKASSSRRTRHINIRYFFVKDRVASGEVTIQYCPTEKMMADYFTKPLQGALFTKMRDEIMNVNPDHYDYALEDCRSVLNINDGSSELDDGQAGSWVTVMSKKTKRKVSHGSENTPSEQTRKIVIPPTIPTERTRMSDLD